jgi:predicted nuclease of restriction endonuclease-like (RecB) superfamily
MNLSICSFIRNIAHLLESARRASARTVNAVMTATYWEIGRRIVEFEQRGEKRAAYGEKLIVKLARDLTARFGRGFSEVNLSQMKRFYLTWPKNFQTVSEKSSAGNLQTSAEKSAMNLAQEAVSFPLPWSHYVRLMTVQNIEARRFYESEALRGGWSVRQLDRQIASVFYERTALSRNKVAMLKKGAKAPASDVTNAEAEIRDPLVLEFLGLKDEYSENDLEEALLLHLERFLLELGGDFAFVGRQRRLRIGHEWYRIDLLFFHRRLRCLVVIDLKVGRFTPGDAGQMHLYLNYAREHWTHEAKIRRSGSSSVRNPTTLWRNMRWRACRTRFSRGNTN